MLTNPLYAGRIRHRKVIYDGQHPPIITPELWQAVQDRLKAEAAKARDKGTTGSSFRSVLTGKIFDETGDRLTPSHGGTRGGIRHRYYVSHRLIARSGEADVSGWRLPAQMLEDVVLRVASRYLADPAFPARAIMDATATNLVVARSRIAELLGEEDAARDRRVAVVALIARIDLAPGQLTISVDPVALASLLSISADRLDAACLAIVTTFTMRRRGVETRLILGNERLPLDRKLIRNIAVALSWLDRIKAGQSQAEIAAADGIRVWRVQQALHYAFLAPDIIRQVMQGHQPLGLTSKWILRHPMPMGWADQRALIATL